MRTKLTDIYNHDVLCDAHIQLTGHDEQFMRSVAHRGYSETAPENTLAAFKEAKKMGFNSVECDVQFTKDNVPVLLHDNTIDRTSNGTGSIANLTYEYVSSLDFGSWKSSKYVGEKIPTFEEFMLLCKRLSLHVYIELKYTSIDTTTYTQEQLENVYNIVKKHNMLKNVSWISFSTDYLEIIKNIDNTARLGFLMSEVSPEYTGSTYIATLQSLKTDNNIVFLDMLYSIVSDSIVDACMDNSIPIEVWTVDTEEEILELNPYVSGVTSNTLKASEVLYRHVIE